MSHAHARHSVPVKLSRISGDQT